MTRREAFTCLAMFAFGLGLTWAVANVFTIAWQQ